ncbi:MAG: hypothetical protein AAF513_01340 [Pseudomonadota bacterium]
MTASDDLEQKYATLTTAAAELEAAEDAFNELLMQDPEAFETHLQRSDRAFERILDFEPEQEVPAADDNVAALDVAAPRATVAPSGQLVASGGAPRWMANAAMLMVGVGLATILGIWQPFQAPDAQRLVIGSAQVYPLDAFRTATPQVEVITLDRDEPLTTLIIYPDIADATPLQAVIARVAGDLEDPGELQGAAWETLSEMQVGPGSRDSLAINLPTPMLTPGIYRIVAQSLTTDATRTTVYFRVVYPD